MDGSVNLQGSGVMDGSVNLQGSGVMDSSVMDGNQLPGLRGDGR